MQRSAASPQTARREILKELAAYIRLRSVTDRGNGAVARRMADYLKRHGFRVSFQRLKQDGQTFFNVIGMKGPRGRPLLLCAHLDTVPSGPASKWTRTGGDPWRATFSGGQIFGLGSADDKGPLVAILRAVRGWDGQLKRPLMVMGTFGEERGMRGADLFVKKWRGPKPFLALPAEPTNLEPIYRHKGLGVIEVDLSTSLVSSLDRRRPPRRLDFIGKQGHSSRPWLGVNALDKAIKHLKLRPLLPSECLVSIEGGHACNLIPGEASLFVGRVSGKGAVKRVPVHDPRALIAAHDAVQATLKRFAKPDPTFRPPRLTSNFGIARVRGPVMTLTFDFRLMPGQTIQPILRVLAAELRRRSAGLKGTRFAMRVERHNPPLALRKGDRVVREVSAMAKGAGLSARVASKAGCTEAGTYHRWGVPSLVFGPGIASGNIHCPNERVPLRHIEAAERFYRHAIRRLLVERGGR